LKLIRQKCRIRKCNLAFNCSNIALELCKYKLKAKNKVDILFVGEAGGEQEHLMKRPFVGVTGQLLRSIIAATQKQHKYSYGISNVVRTRPTKNGRNRTPTYKECNTCGRNLKREIKFLNPKIIVAVGATAYNYLMKLQCKVLRDRNCVRSFNIGKKEYPIILTPHPSYYTRAVEKTLPGLSYRDIEKAYYYTKDITFTIPNKVKTVYLDTILKIKKCLNSLKRKAEVVAIDTECANLHRVYNNTIFSVQLCNDGIHGYVIPMTHYDSPFSLKEIEEIKDLLTDFFITKKSKVTGYVYWNAKYDLHQFFRELQILLPNAPILDAQYGYFLLEENLTRIKMRGVQPYSLADVSWKHGFTLYHTQEKMDKSKRTMFKDMPISEWVDYAAADAVVTYNLHKVFLKIAKVQNYDMYYKMLSIVGNAHTISLTYMEHCGLPCSITELRKLASERSSSLLISMKKIKSDFNNLNSVQKVMKKVFKKTTGSSTMLFGAPKNAFNINTKLHAQLLFFDILRLKPLKTGKLIIDGKVAGSIDDEFLKHYKDKDIPEIDLLVKYKKLETLYTKFVIGIYNFMNTKSGNPDFYTDRRIRPQFGNRLTTGRTSAWDPNSQQRPSDKERAKVVLDIYESEKGRCIVKLDFKVHEVRGLQIVSHDPVMKENFNKILKLVNNYRKNPESIIENDTTLLDIQEIIFKKLNAKKKWKMYQIDLFKWIEKISTEEIRTLLYSEFKTSIKNPEKYYSANYFKRKITKILNTTVKKQLIKNNLKYKTDVHIQNASTFFQVALEKVTKKLRQDEKGVMFGVTYGMGDASLANVLGTTVRKALKIKNAVFEKLQIATKWLDNAQVRAKEQLYDESILGRRRRLWGYLFPAKDQYIHAAMDRLARNNIIQGMSSDFALIAISMFIKYIYKIGKGKYQVDDFLAWFVINFVHDSMESEIPCKDLNRFLMVSERFFTTKLVKFIEENFDYKFGVMFEVDYEVGTTFSNMKKWDGTKSEALKLQKWVTEL
jgi:uracil-DNA glycosylase family 4